MKQIIKCAAVGTVVAAAFIVSIPRMPIAFGETASGIMAQGSVNAFPKALRTGDQGEDVKTLQQILKVDPSVYPQGLVSGYFGKLTEEALKNLQRKYGLPPTGILDDATERAIFPFVQLTVAAPNGGEVWDKSQIQTILWKSTFSSAQPLPAMNDSSMGSMVHPVDNIVPFFRYVSIDLLRDSTGAEYHVATADLLQSQYAWKIPNAIPEGRDYRIRISFGRRVPCIYELEGRKMMEGQAPENFAPRCPLMPEFNVQDVSDNPFAITGQSVPVPDPALIQKLKEQVRMMEAIVNQLASQIQAIKQILQQF